MSKYHFQIFFPRYVLPDPYDHPYSTCGEGNFWFSKPPKFYASVSILLKSRSKCLNIISKSSFPGMFYRIHMIIHILPVGKAIFGFPNHQNFMLLFRFFLSLDRNV
ncbi:hypothetical protein FRX31_029026 [Thalictrum thalictroides]|uniref:Uncharacterized protein n=1 Tax=Thalictrum thalictroides TaxID=46969 RepID=A0A7J6VB03_THATH|nr:hypothetical protein FRX31_029026 [Thalictrum thalictroides]